MWSCVRLGVVYGLATVLAGCGEDGNHAPTASSITLTATEDLAASGALRGVDSDGEAVQFRALVAPKHGSLTVDQSTGAFTYVPEPDFFGADSFSYFVTDGRRKSSPARVAITVANVNDAPTVAPIPNLDNSAESRDTVYQMVANDVDGDALDFEASSSDPDVATVAIDPISKALVITPISYGLANVRIVARDAVLTAERTFEFSVGDVTKSREISTDPSQAIVFTNTSDQAVRFTLTHNDFPMFQSDQEIIQFVQAMAAAYPGEPFERKLWRFVRDNVYHSVQLSNDEWQPDPWVSVNSLGWGLCSQVAFVYVRIARAAGYSARIWGITGHVIPEIRVNGRWEMYDPDLAVYYLNHNGQVAGVAELGADTSIITSPLNPVFSLAEQPFPYSNSLAELYGTVGDNVAASAASILAPTNYQPLILPPGAVLTYPIHVDASVQGTHVGVNYEIPHYLQAALTLNAGWEGEVILPWVVWGISGEGVVEIGGVEFAVGSQALNDRIRNTLRAITTVRVVHSQTPLTVTLFINALRYELEAQNGVRLTGKDVWALDARAVTVPLAKRAPRGQARIYAKAQGAF